MGFMGPGEKKPLDGFARQVKMGRNGDALGNAATGVEKPR